MTTFGLFSLLQRQNNTPVITCAVHAVCRMGMCKYTEMDQVHSAKIICKNRKLELTTLSTHRVLMLFLAGLRIFKSMLLFKALILRNN